MVDDIHGPSIIVTLDLGVKRSNLEPVFGKLHGSNLCSATVMDGLATMITTLTVLNTENG